MRALISSLGTGITVLFLFSAVWGQPNVQSVVDRWNDMPLGQTNWGTFTAVTDPCYPDSAPVSLELPGGSGQNYLYVGALWIGALIWDSAFVYSARVSVGTDGWFNPSIDELYPGPDESMVERSRLDTVDCFGQPILDPDAIADHEYVATFEDTLTDDFYIVDDPVDGAHRPLGLKITRTTYAMLDGACNHIYWIKYHVQNIGSNFLKNLYIGHFVDVDVAHESETVYYGDDLCGFDPVSESAYWCDNDGRAFGDTSGNDFVVPNVVGLYYFPTSEYNLGDSMDAFDAPVSFNWWLSNGAVSLDFGPSWEAYCSRDSLGMGWTSLYGTPVGDGHKYDLMRNREIDYPYVYHVNEWPPPDGDQVWCTLDPTPGPTDAWLKMLHSIGPTGIYEYTEADGDRIYRLNPGESFDCWVALVGGMNLHDPEQPQHDPWIEPAYFDFSDLRDRVESAHSGCLDWAQAAGGSRPVVSAFDLEPIYPNPFNSTARVRFALRIPARVEIAVYDVLGRQAQTLDSRIYDSGIHELSWDAKELSSGIYFVQAKTEKQLLGMQKAVLLK